MSNSIYGFAPAAKNGEKTSLEQYHGKVLLIVNTASKCGFTPQFDGLEQLNKEYAEKGLQILGFPCNQFGKQDPGSNDEITEFCQLNYGVSFPMLAKIDVNGNDAEPLFDYLKSEAKGLLGSKNIKWNFTKFLISKDGKKIQRFAPATKPKDLAAEIEKLLSE